MPDYDNEPNEWESNRPAKLPRHISVQLKQYTTRIQGAHTVGALKAIRSDIEQGSLANNAEAKAELKRTMNQRARELGFQEGPWWS